MVRGEIIVETELPDELKTDKIEALIGELDGLREVLMLDRKTSLEWR